VGYICLIASVYFFSALLKTSPEWRTEGTAIYYALSIDQIRLPFGTFLYQFPMLMKVLTFIVFYIELIAPILMIVPFVPKKVRIIGVALIAFIHLGFCMSLYVGLFYIIGLSSLIGLLSSKNMDWFENHFYKNKVIFEKEENTQYKSHILFEGFTILKTWFIVFVITYCIMLNLGNVKAFPYALESYLFKYMYQIYKVVFKILSGYVISFGNFVLIPKNQLSHLVFISEIWNHFPGGIMRSRIPYISVPIDRGRRYQGQSKMSLVSLVQHGISSITVNIDIVSVRLLLFSVALMFITFAMFCILISLKLFGSYAIPGWTSTISIGLLMIMLQSFFFSLLLTFMVLNARVQKNFIPALNHLDYIRSLNQYKLNV